VGVGRGVGERIHLCKPRRGGDEVAETAKSPANTHKRK